MVTRKGLPPVRDLRLSEPACSRPVACPAPSRGNQPWPWRRRWRRGPDLSGARGERSLSCQEGGSEVSNFSHPIAAQTPTHAPQPGFPLHFVHCPQTRSQNKAPSSGLSIAFVERSKSIHPPPPPASHPSAVFFPLAPAALSQSQGTTLHASRAPARANLPCAPSRPRTAGSPGPRTYSRVQRGRGTGRSEAELAFRPRGRRPELGRLGPQRARLALGSLGSHPTRQAGAQKAEVFGGEKHSFF